MKRKMKNPILPVPPWKLVKEFEKLDDEGRAWAVHQAMVLVWDSLNSHLMHTYKGAKKDRDFEKRCVQEYSVVLGLLARLF